jgi:hypothetical protein
LHATTLRLHATIVALYGTPVAAQEADDSPSILVTCAALGIFPQQLAREPAL